MADYLRARREADLEQTAILVKEGSDSAPPLFCVSGKGGSVVVFRELAKRLGPDQTFYGLTHHGLSRTAFPKTFAALAACYADTIRTLQPEGPYFVAGYSAGGLVAFDIARQLSRAGHEVAFVGIMDAAARPQHVARWKRYAKRAILLRNKPVQSTKRYLRSFALRAKNLLKKAPPTALEERNRIYDTIARRTSMEPYGGRVTLFLARHGWGFDGTSRDLGWTPLAGELEIIDVDGEHATILRDDVDSLGNAMRTVLERLRVSS
jgi:thioesterase domain-containing protein